MIRGAIFDMDGVLVDNVSQHTEAWKELGRELGQEWSEDKIKGVFGKRNSEILQTLIDRRLSKAEIETLGRRKEELYRSIMAPDLAPVPGLEKLLDELRIRGVRTAVATSGPTENTQFVLRGLGLEGRFDALVTGGDAPRSKPDPGIFLVAAERLGLEPSLCVVFEDSPVGLKGARAAGCPAVALATTHSEDELRQYSPDLIIRDFTEVDIRKLLDLQADPA